MLMSSEEPRPTTPATPATPTIQFSSDPAEIEIGEGLSVAARYWRATADLWMLPVAIVAAVTAVVTWAMPGPGSGWETLSLTDVPGTDPMTVIGPLLPQLVVSTIVVGSVTMVASWIYLAIAIAGLRGYRVMPDWILRRGVRAFAADLLVTIAFGALFGVLALLTVGGGPGLMVVVMAVAFVPAIYLSVRLIFWSLAIFDGADIVVGFHATWRISRGSVPRMLGWGILVAVIGLVVRAGAELVTMPIGDGNPVRAGITAAITEVFAAYSTIALAVIYESQRRRTILASPRTIPSTPAAVEPAVSSNPFEPPPPPAR